jgi:hypothetical protein
MESRNSKGNQTAQKISLDNPEKSARIESSTTQRKFKMTTATKIVNYTESQTTELVSAYLDSPTAETVASFAVTFGKSVRSIVAKLSREGVYMKAERTTKSGEPIQKKDATADAIGAVLMLTEAETESLTKANKTALVKIFAALANSRPI